MLGDKRRKFRAGSLYTGLLVLLLLPLLFIQVNDFHNWGDDAFQYLNQAKMVTQGKLQTETGYIYNPDFVRMGPPAYPPFFPFLLTPIHFFAQDHISPYLYFMGLMLIAGALLTWFIFKRFTHPVLALLAVLFFAYNIQVLDFKAEVLSELPFTAISLLLIFLFMRWRNNLTLRKQVFLGVLTAFLIGTRSIGVALALAVFTEQLISQIRNKKPMLHQFLWVPVALVVYFFMNYLAYGRAVGIESAFADSFFNEGWQENFVGNTRFYFDRLREFFGIGNWFLGEWKAISLFMVVLMLAGLFSALFYRNTGFIAVYILLSVLVILLYKERASGIRYLISLFPLMLVMVFVQLSRLKPKVLVPVSFIFLSLSMIYYAYAYRNEFKRVFSSSGNSDEGPYQNEIQEAFNYLKREVGEEEIILFRKPRAMAYFTGRRSLSTYPEQEVKAIDSTIRVHGIDYLMMINEFPDDSVSAWIGKGKPIWQNEEARIYSLAR